MLYALLVTLHIVVSVILILVVLLQTGKSADLAGAFGGGGSQTAFGSRGAATFLTKLTTSAAVIFMLTSFTLSVYSTKGGVSVLDDTEATGSAGAQAPAAPALPVLPAADDGIADDTAGPDDELAPATSEGVQDDTSATSGAKDPDLATERDSN